MASGQSEKVLGLKELKRNLRALPTVMKNKVLLFGTQEAARTFQKLAKRKAPVGRGYLDLRKTKKGPTWKKRHLRDMIGVKKVRAPGGGQVKYVVYIRKGQARRYAHLVEFGVKAHRISAHTINYIVQRKNGEKKVLALPGGRYVSSVMHPGSKAQPFMRPAFNEGYTLAIDRLVKRVNKEIKKQGGKWYTR